MKDHPARTLAQIALALRRENVLLVALVPLIFCTVLLLTLSQEVTEASETRMRTPSEHVRKYQRQREVVLAEEPRQDFWIEKILDQPRVFVLHNLITPGEADLLMAYGETKGMSEALITPYGSSQLVPSTTRTNTAAWLDFNQNELVARIEGKLAEATGTLPEDAENLQILHYANGNQYFQEHRDYFDPKEDPPENFETGGNRMVTAILYLKTPEEGGETYFVKIDLALKVKPGDAIVFWNLKRDGEVDPDTYHSALPPTKGEKWVGVKWIHERRYQMNAGPPVQKQKKIELVNKPVSVAS